MRINDADMQQMYINTPQRRFTLQVLLESSVIMLYFSIATINTKKYGATE